MCLGLTRCFKCKIYFGNSKTRDFVFMLQSICLYGYGKSQMRDKNETVRFLRADHDSAGQNQLVQGFVFH